MAPLTLLLYLLTTTDITSHHQRLCINSEWRGEGETEPPTRGKVEYPKSKLLDRGLVIIIGPKIATFLRIFAPKGEISNKSDGLNVKSSIRERICSMNLVYTLLMGLIYIYIFVRIFGRWKGAKGKMGLKNRRGIKPRSIFLHAFSAIFSIRSKISREYIDYDGTWN